MGATQRIGSFRTSHPAAPGLILGISEFRGNYNFAEFIDRSAMLK